MVYMQVEWYSIYCMPVASHLQIDLFLTLCGDWVGTQTVLVFIVLAIIHSSYDSTFFTGLIAEIRGCGRVLGQQHKQSNRFETSPESNHINQTTYLGVNFFGSYNQNNVI